MFVYCGIAIIGFYPQKEKHSGELIKNSREGNHSEAFVPLWIYIKIFMKG